MKPGELKLTVHVVRDIITAIDTEIFCDGAWEKAVAPKVSPWWDMFPGWDYIMPVTKDANLHIKIEKR